MNKIIILVEGEHEKRIINDIKNYNPGGIKMKDKYSNFDIEVIKAAQIEHEYLDFKKNYDNIIFVYDNDVANVNEKVKDVIKMSKREEINFLDFDQSPFLETFLCSFFSKFINKKEWSIKMKKDESIRFLKKEFGIDVMPEKKQNKMKKITISEIIKYGGEIKNILGREEEFKIMKLFNFKNV